MNRLKQRIYLVFRKKKRIYRFHNILGQKLPFVIGKLGHKFSRVQSQISTLDVLMIAWHIKGQCSYMWFNINKTKRWSFYLYIQRELPLYIHNTHKNIKLRKMEKKLSVAMMVFVLVVMAAIGGEAINHLCTFKCEITCRDPEFKSECFRACMADCDHDKPTSTFHSTKAYS